jgi:hypothetical protein
MSLSVDDNERHGSRTCQCRAIASRHRNPAISGRSGCFPGCSVDSERPRPTRNATTIDFNVFYVCIMIDSQYRYYEAKQDKRGHQQRSIRFSKFTKNAEFERPCHVRYKSRKVEHTGLRDKTQRTSPVVGTTTKNLIVGEQNPTR